ncbi:MAG: hypothetical protein ACRDIY_18820 [Chloroflexota bacterium]
MNLGHVNALRSGDPTAVPIGAEGETMGQFISTGYGLVLIAWSVIFEGVGFLMMYFLIRATIHEGAHQDPPDRSSPRE